MLLTEMASELAEQLYLARDQNRALKFQLQTWANGFNPHEKEAQEENETPTRPKERLSQKKRTSSSTNFHDRRRIFSDDDC